MSLKSMIRDLPLYQKYVRPVRVWMSGTRQRPGRRSPSMNPFRAYGAVRRLQIPWRYHGTTIRSMVAWAWGTGETWNFIYDLTPRNKKYLASFVAVTTGRPVAEVEGFVAEVEADESLRAHVGGVYYGRRLGWYALVRALKPRVVVETGVDQGLGSCVIAAALRRNAGDGSPGRYYGTDINPDAGRLFTAPYSEVGEILYGDSIGSLQGLLAGGIVIDMFINDSDHSADYEQREYQLVASALANDAVVVGDNAHVTLELSAFARQTGRDFLFFKEEPTGHWYPGAGIGVAFASSRGAR
jgi:hypothetical protein